MGGFDLSDLLWPDVSQGRQPQGYGCLDDVDPQHPLASDIIDLITPWSSFKVSGSPTVAPVTNGRGLRGDGTSAYYYRDTAPNVDIRNCTLLAYVQGACGYDSRLLSYGSSASNEPILAIGSSSVVATKLRAWARDSAGSIFSYADSTAVAFEDAAPHVCVLASGRDVGDVSDRLATYVDGKLQTSGVVGYVATSFNRTCVGGLLRSAFATGSTSALILGILFKRRLSGAEIAAVSKNPFLVIKRNPALPFIVPSAGGGGITIACTPGNATTAGIPASISAATTIACNVGGATTAGVACALPIKIACNAGNTTTSGIACSLPVVVQCGVGTATTAGVSASISLASSITISCNAGNSTTAGVTAGISSATTISCNTGTATTAGVLAVVSSATTIACNVGGASTAGVACALPIKIACNAGGATTAGVTTTFPQSISCNVGNATTAGVTAGIAGATTISCNVGNVSVAGITAGISSAITISCDAGTATTSGIAASFPQTLSCNVGNATTAGITAQVDIAGQIVIGCNAGTATTAGISANISSAVVLACNPGNATTLGATAYFPQSLQCTPGNAIALGIDATFTVTGPTTIVCNAGNAYAAGVSCDFGSRFDTPPDAIVAVINKRNRVSVISRRS